MTELAYVAASRAAFCGFESGPTRMSYSSGAGAAIRTPITDLRKNSGGGGVNCTPDSPTYKGACLVSRYMLVGIQPAARNSMAGLAEWLKHWIVAPVTRVRFSHLAPKWAVRTRPAFFLLSYTSASLQADALLSWLRHLIHLERKAGLSSLAVEDGDYTLEYSFDGRPVEKPGA